MPDNIYLSVFISVDIIPRKVAIEGNNILKKGIDRNPTTVIIFNVKS